MGFKQSIQYYLSKKKRIAETKKRFSKPIPFPSSNHTTFTFPIFEKPRVSILLYSNGESSVTKSCLRSIFDNLPLSSFEIILLTNSSNSRREYDDIYNIQLIELSKSNNKLQAYNHGIKHAKGEYIYFLDDNSLVQNGFLDCSLEVFDTRMNVAAVGSKILLSNGTVVEAGGFILKNLSLKIRNDIPSYFPEVNYVQKIDFCSSNGLLIPRKDTNRDLVQFDCKYESEILEEVNLCIQLQNSGNDLYLSPFSVLVKKKENKNHYLKQLNHDFTKKWGKHLNHIQAQDISERSCELYKNKQVIFFHYKLPEVENSSGDLRFTEIMKEFVRLGYQGCIATTKNTISNPYNEYYQKLGLCVLYEHVSGNELLSYLKRTYYRNPVAWFYSIITFKKFYDKVKGLIPQARIIFDMVDIHHLRIKRALDLEPTNSKYQKEYPRFLSWERWASQVSDVVIPISEKEAEYMEDFCPKDKLIVLSNVHYPKVQLDNIPRFEDRKGLVFVGSRHTPNIDAVNYLLDEIMPLVWKKEKDITLNIIGDINTLIPIEKQNINKVHFHGFVPDIKPYLLQNKIMVAPLRYGAGVKGKVGQAFEYYLPVITSSIGAEGMYLKDDINALLAEDAQDFAHKIIRLNQDKELWEKLQSNSEASLFPFSLQKLREQLQLIIKG